MACISNWDVTAKPPRLICEPNWLVKRGEKDKNAPEPCGQNFGKSSGRSTRIVTAQSRTRLGASTWALQGSSSSSPQAQRPRPCCSVSLGGDSLVFGFVSGLLLPIPNPTPILVYKFQAAWQGVFGSVCRRVCTIVRIYLMHRAAA
jgi:hypothetical protein